MTTLIERIQELMLYDEEDQSERLQATYHGASPEQRKAIDDTFICLCGYSLNTIIAGDA